MFSGPWGNGMRTFAFCSLVALWAAIPAPAALATESDIDFGVYHALVIGNDEYRQLPPLKSAVNDARAVRDLLMNRYGFQVTLLENATRNEILLALNQLRGELTENDNLVIYYAGHGTLERQTETGYWLPVDADKDNDINWLANSELTRRLRAMSARHVMIIADSCYSGTLLRAAPLELPTGAERQAWLARMAQMRSRTAIVSGGLEPVLDSGSNSHSVFANAFLKVLGESKEPIDGGALHRQIGRRVIVNAVQTPLYSDIRQADHEGGEFIFVPVGWSTATAAVSDTATAPKAAAGSAAEIAFWQTIRDEKDPAVFRAYLLQFPDGTFAPLARLRIKDMEQTAPPAETQPPTKIEEAKLQPDQAKPRLETPPAKTEEAAPDVAVEEMRAIMITSVNSNVRAGPTVEAPRLLRLEKGSEVTVTGSVQGGRWYRIEVEAGQAAFIYGNLLVTPEEWAKAERLAELAPAAGLAAPKYRSTTAAGNRPSRTAALAPPPPPVSLGPRLTFANSSGTPVNSSTEQVVHDVVRQTIDAHLWQELDEITVVLTQFSIRREANPDYLGTQMAKAFFGKLGRLVPNTSPTIQIVTVDLSINITAKSGARHSDSARTEQYDYAQQDPGQLVMETLLETVRRASARVSVQLLGGMPPPDTRYTVLGKHEAPPPSSQSDYPGQN